jgi:predicted permease
MYVSQVLDRLASVPGIEAAGGIDDLFQLNVPGKLGFRAVEGQRSESRQEWTALTWDAVSGDYFHAMGAKLLRGRFFTDQDGPDSPLVAVIDESLARRYWPNEDPIGKRFKGEDPRGRNDDWLTVIGVVRNMRRQGLERETTPHVYEWYRQSQALTRDIVVRTRGNPANFATAVRAAVRSVDRTAVIARVTTLDGEIEEQTTERRFQTWLMGLFASVGLGLAAIGIYGLMHYTVAHRTREIAIRMAVGARVEQVVGMTLREGVVLSLIGAAAGIAAAFWTNRLLAGLLFGVRPGDLWTLVSASLLLIAGALLGSALPAFRAAKVDPVTVLRFD